MKKQVPKAPHSGARHGCELETVQSGHNQLGSVESTGLATLCDIRTAPRKDKQPNKRP